jgi:DNA-3-methyladenine glycosylase I
MDFFMFIRGSKEDKMNRCAWTGANELMMAYHDTEWGVPLHDDQKLFEFLILEGMQAGLSWSTILNKRENFRRAFAEFDVEKVAHFGTREIDRLLQDAGIIRNRLKIEAAINNAQRCIEVQKEIGSFDAYIWGFVNGRPIQNGFKSLQEIPAKTLLSDAISKDLKARGFKFVGSTIIYAHMQATGMVNDHTIDCFRYQEVNR